jgi:hypothetical protein
MIPESVVSHYHARRTSPIADKLPNSVAGPNKLLLLAVYIHNFIYLF